jgi:hypothetical protein
VFGLPESYEYFEHVLDTPVHGNIAWDPIFINPQVLPKELKQKATLKYKKYLNTVEPRGERNKRIHRFINQNMNFLNDKDQSQHFEQFIRFTKTLDRTRSTSMIEVIPEFANYV